MSSRPLISFEKISEEHPFFLDPEECPDWEAQFQNKHPLKLEIGFGNGNFLIEMAVREPFSNFIGMDFYHKGIRKTMSRVDRLHIPNIRVVYGNALEKIPMIFKDGELSEIFINFPDPWPKKRHYKRRLIKPHFVNQLARKLTDNGTLNIATDYEPYAMEILEFLDAEPQLANKLPVPGYRHQRGDVPKTKYEKTFINEGKTIYYFEFAKKAETPFSSSLDVSHMN